jgi:hypothetical protein
MVDIHQYNRRLEGALERVKKSGQFLEQQRKKDYGQT